MLAAVSLSHHRVQRSSSSGRTGVIYEGHVSPVAGTYTKPDRANKCLQLKKLKRMERRRKEKSNKRSNLKGREVLVRQKEEVFTLVEVRSETHTRTEQLFCDVK